MKRLLRAFILAACLQALVDAGGRPEFITDELMQMVTADKQRCMAEHGTTEAMIDAVNEGKTPNDRAITCYMYCLFEAFSLVDEDGDLEVEMLVGFLPENLQAEAQGLLEECAKTTITDVCDKIYTISTCIQNKREGFWFMV